MALLSQIEAAKLIDRDPSKINKWCQEKRLKLHFLPGKRRGLVDSDEVLRLRDELELGAKFTPAAKLKPIEPGGSNAPTDSRSQAPPPHKKKIADLTEEDFELFNSQGKLDAVQCRAWGEFEKSRKLQIERLALEGQYVLAAEVGPQFQSAMLTINKGVLATTSRLKALHPDLSQSVLDSLDKLLREALEKAVKDSTDGN